jgi:Flp pilus assembly protein TadG
LLLLVGGIVDFGRLLYTEIIVTNAAREGVRMAAMGFASEAQNRVDAASPSLALVGSLATTPCSGASSTFSEVRYTVTTVEEFEWLLLDAFMKMDAPQPAATASMRCGG